MDDVEDDSELRRGIPVAHSIYGIPQTINTANYVYFRAMQELLSLAGSTKGKEKAVDLMGVVTGESGVLCWRPHLAAFAGVDWWCRDWHHRGFRI